MVEFCDEVAQRILLAKDRDEVEVIIRNSFVVFSKKLGSFNPTYAINMIVTLLALKPKAKTIPEVNNITYAIKFFREHKATNIIRLF